MSERIFSASRKVSSLHRWRPPGDPAIAEAERDLRFAQLDEHIREIVAAAPPLTDEQRSKLALLLNPGSRAPASA